MNRNIPPRLYRILLLAYPAQFRRDYGLQMAQVFRDYPFALSLTLGDRFSFAQQIKTYANNDETDTRYSPRKVTAIRNKSVFGRPDMDRVSTSYVERFNLEMRRTARRFTRLTLSYSKKLANHKAMIALASAYHNLCRYHQNLRATPCMAQGITKSIWSIEDLLTATI